VLGREGADLRLVRGHGVERVDIHLVEVDQRRVRMRVAVDEARRDERAVQVDRRGAGADVGGRAGVVADVHDRSVFDCDGLSQGVRGILGGDDTVRVDGVGYRRRAHRARLRPGGACHRPGDEQGCEQATGDQ